MSEGIDFSLEAAIDEVGRDRVFALVRASGWSPGDAVPKFVWHEAVVALRQENHGDADA